METLDRYEFSPRQRRSKYPWKDMLDGRIKRARYGQDFEIEPDTFLTTVKNKARSEGFRVTDWEVEDDGSVVFRAVERDS